jgi:hypothetical protein
MLPISFDAWLFRMKPVKASATMGDSDTPMSRVMLEAGVHSRERCHSLFGRITNVVFGTLECRSTDLVLQIYRVSGARSRHRLQAATSTTKRQVESFGREYHGLLEILRKYIYART